MMAKVDKPEIGAEMYAVFEHLYSNKSAPARSLKEYCVCKGTVRSFYTGGYTEVCLLFTGPHGFPQPGYYKHAVQGAGRMPAVKLLQTGGHRQKAILQGSGCRRVGQKHDREIRTDMGLDWGSRVPHGQTVGGFIGEER